MILLGMSALDGESEHERASGQQRSSTSGGSPPTQGESVAACLCTST